MNTKGLIISGSVIAVTVFFVVAYTLFNALGVTQSRVVRNEITIVTGSADKLYDGTALSNDEWYIESGSLAEGDTLITTMNTSIINPSSVPNQIGVTILNSEGENVTINYRVNLELGMLTIYPIELTIKTQSASKYFDGNPLSKQEWSLQSGQLLEGHQFAYSMNASITEPGTINNEIDITILNSTGTNMNHIYNITYDLGKLTVLERDLEISTSSLEKTYDGSPLQGGPASITSGSLANGHTIEYGPQAAITNPGSTPNERDVTIYDTFQNDVTSLYNITYNSGTLTVYKRELTIRSASDSKVYDGTPLSNSDWDLVSGSIISSHTLTVSIDNEITNVGSIDNILYATVTNSSNEDVTYLYDITYDPGTLTIEAKDLVIETGSASKTYDGTPLTFDNWSLVLGELSPNHRIEYDMTSSITMPGDVENRIFIQILNQNNEDVTDEYNIDYVYGTLEIFGRNITVQSPSYEQAYNGSALRGGGVSITFGTLLNGHSMEFGPAPSLTNPGLIDNEVDIYIFDSLGNDVTRAYDITEDFGTLTVWPITLIISSPDDTKIYDGTPLSNNTWDLVGGALLPGHSLVVDIDNEITLPGVKDNEMNAFVLDTQGNDVSNIYDFEYIEGRLSVYPREITIQTITDSKGYDGTALLGGEGTITVGSLLLGHTVSYDTESSITNPGTIENEVTITIYDDLGNDVTDGYDINDDFGTLTIEAITLIISSADDSKLYDGTPLSNTTWTLVGGSTLPGHTLSVNLTESITFPGSIDNEMTAFVLNTQGNDVTDFYDFEYIEGTLTIDPIHITVSTIDDTKSYDGLPLTGGTGTITLGSLLPNHTMSFGAEASITIPGSIENEIAISIQDNLGNDVTDAYTITEDFGTLTILPITIIIKSDDASKLYDGQPLTNQSWILFSGDLLDGHELTVDMDSEITLPGSTDNEMIAFVLDAFDTDVSEIYDIQYLEGTLTVFPIDITITTTTLEKDYDGTPLLGGSGSITFGTLLDGHSETYGPQLSITNPGTIDNDVAIRIYDDQLNDVTDAYDITEDYGTLTINPITIVMESPDASQQYNGLPLSANTYTQLSGTLLDGHELVVIIDNQITLPGSIDNEFLVFVEDAFGNDVTDSYDIQYITGTLTVTGIPITISTGTTSKEYDGTPLLGGIGTITSGSTILDHYVDYGTEISITVPGSISNAISYTIKDLAGNDVTEIYDITDNPGTLTIDPITIVIKSPDDSKIYDGTPLYSDAWELISGAVILDHTLYVDVDNSITDVGSIDNTMIPYVLTGSGTDVTDYYEFTHLTGTLTVLSSAYSSSQIATSSFDIPEEDAFRVYTVQTGVLYFRDRSLGDYIGDGWTAGVEQNTSITENPLQFPSIALEEAGYLSSLIQIEYLRDQIPFLSPYYTSDLLSGLSDIHTSGDTSVVNDINVIFYTFNELDDITIQDGPTSLEEQTYRTYVYQNYLDIPASTGAEMLTLAAQNGLSAASPTVIQDVQNYIRSAAVYNLDFEPIPATEDVAVYFLTVSKEGICQHYATAATLMYRALGIPARYVTGYASPVTMNQWNTVTSLMAHAWTEVYIDGLGWVPVEVTGSPFEPIDIVVQPSTVREVYEEGKTITASSLLIFGYPTFAAEGYTYTATYGGSLSEIGTASSTVNTINIYDALGNDVTYRFNITKVNGILQLYGYSLEVSTDGGSKTYDGTPLTNSTYNIIGGSLEPNHHIETVTFTGSQIDVGTSKNRAYLVIYDEFNNDVTSSYNITYTYGDLVVFPTSITITSDSGSKVFDGTPLIVDTYTITDGTLATTDTIQITITGSQTGIGKSDNTVQSVTITRDGTDISFNYIINIVEGDLTVTPY